VAPVEHNQDPEKHRQSATPTNDPTTIATIFNGFQSVTGAISGGGGGGGTGSLKSSEPAAAAGTVAKTTTGNVNRVRILKDATTLATIGAPMCTEVWSMPFFTAATIAANASARR